MLYNEQLITEAVNKTRYERAHRLEVTYPLNGTPQLVFHTSWVERDEATGEEKQLEFSRSVGDTYSADEGFPLFTGGTATHEDLMGLLYSLFFHTMSKEDAA